MHMKRVFHWFLQIWWSTSFYNEWRSILSAFNLCCSYRIQSICVRKQWIFEFKRSCLNLSDGHCVDNNVLVLLLGRTIYGRFKRNRLDFLSFDLVSIAYKSSENVCVADKTFTAWVSFELLRFNRLHIESVFIGNNSNLIS